MSIFVLTYKYTFTECGGVKQSEIFYRGDIKMQSLKVLKKSAVVACALSLLSPIVIAANNTAYALPSSEATIEISNGFSPENAQAVNGLIAELGANSYAKLDEVLQAQGAIASSEYVSAKTITMGGVVWNVMYVSKADYTANGTSSGDIIVTLWQTNSGEEKSYFSNRLMTGNVNDKYPINSYGTSLVRSSLVGSDYLKVKGAETLDGKGEIKDAWKPFSFLDGEFYSYLATPANMGWQETLSATEENTVGREYNLVSDAWGTPSRENWQAAGNNYGAKTGEALQAYQAWKDDRIWLPSLAETGESDAADGLWQTVAEQRKSDSQCWLRSGPVNGSVVNVSALGAGSLVNQTVFQSRNVRPAIHLNLKLAATAAGIDLNGHDCDWGEWSVVTPSTCVSKGRKERVCSVCGEKQTEVIPVDLNAHDFAEDFAVDTQATCTADGSKSKHCKREGCEGKTDVTAIEKTGHSFTQYQTDEGGETQTSVCDNGCGATDTKVIEKTDTGVSVWVWVGIGAGAAVAVAAVTAVIIVVKKKRGVAE